MRGALLTLFACALALTGLPTASSANAEPAVQARLLVSDPRPYVGEEVILTLEIRHSARLSGRLQVRWPDLENFAAVDLPSPLPRREVDQPEMLVESAAKALRPLTDGAVRLAGAGVSLNDSFHPAPPLSLRVQALPVAGRPAGFAGAVGDVEFDLQADGKGTREISLALYGNAPLETFPAPLFRTAEGERLILLGENLKGHAGERRKRTFRYLHLPGKDPRGEFSFTLPVFNPATGRYRILRAGQARPPFDTGGSAWLLPVAAGVLGTIILRRYRLSRSLEHQLTRLLGRKPAGLSRQRIDAELARRGVPAALRVELKMLWEKDDRQRFAAAPLRAAALLPLASRYRRMAVRLRKAVDKSGRIP